MTQLSAVKGISAWLGKESGAIAVVVLRGSDATFWAADGLKGEEVVAAFEEAMPEMIVSLNALREERAAAKAAKRKKELEKELREKR